MPYLLCVGLGLSGSEVHLVVHHQSQGVVPVPAKAVHEIHKIPDSNADDVKRMAMSRLTFRFFEGRFRVG